MTTMDALVQTPAVASSGSAAPRWAVYKGKRVSDQNTRREKMLAMQKKRREAAQQRVRMLPDSASEEEDEEEDDMAAHAARAARKLPDEDSAAVGNGVCMDVEERAAVNEAQTEALEDVAMEGVGRKARGDNPFKNRLMMSEWMVEIPPDLATAWSFVVCPVGKRCLVIANNSSTCAYQRNGYRIKRFTSALPGGGGSRQKGGYAALDCIYNEGAGVFYALDILCWGDYPVHDSDREFRHFWLHSKLSECEGAGERSHTNDHPFVVLQGHPCTPENVVTATAHALQVNASATSTAPLHTGGGESDMQVDSGANGAPAQIAVDGLLFLHNGAHYTAGATPLAAWLKPHMVSEVLGIAVPTLP